MNHLEVLNQFLKKNSGIDCYHDVKRLIKLRVAEMDNEVPKLLNKAFNHRYNISRIEKQQNEEVKKTADDLPNFEVQLQEQYRQIYLLQEALRKMELEYENLKKVIEIIALVGHYQKEINNQTISTNGTQLKNDMQDINVKFLLNKEYEQRVIESYFKGLEKEHLPPWDFTSLKGINAYEMI